MDLVLDRVFWISLAIGTALYIKSFRAQRNQGLFFRGLRVRRIVATIVGSRSNWVDCYELAFQIGAVTLPVWHLLFRNVPGVEPIFYLGLFGGLAFAISRTALEFIAARRLKSAEYLLLACLYTFQVNAIGSGLLEDSTVCRHCGFRERRYRFPYLHVGAEPKRTCLGLSASTDMPSALVIPRELAKTLRRELVTGCTLSPVGGSEPTDWYALHSEHILPPAIVSPDSRRHMPYRTPRCEENHGMEFNSAIRDAEISYRTTTFHAPDVSSSYELIGGKMRQGERFLVVSRKVFRLLIRFDKDLLWMCRPVSLVD